MPLHLLGKKSWNVYNADNVARVRRDEAAAKAAEEAEEQRMQEVDAQRRLALLRGETPPPIKNDPKEDDEKAPNTTSDPRLQSISGKRQRKRAGEDDTDFELRVAKQQTESVDQGSKLLRANTSSAPIVDTAGNIDLFGAQDRVEKNEDAEREKRKKEREYEDQYTMRFSNAAGRNAPSKPWYSSSEAAGDIQVSKDVFGNDDPRRHERAAQRMSASDPLAMMKRGAAKVREVKQERKRFLEERESELRKMRRDDREGERRDRRRSRSPHSRHRYRSRSPRRHDRDRDRGRGRESSRERHRSGQRRRSRDRRRSTDRDRDRDSHRHRSRSR